MKIKLFFFFVYLFGALVCGADPLAETARVFANALQASDYSVALCESREFLKISDYELKSGANLLRGTVKDDSGTNGAYHQLFVLEPIKGGFDRVVCYDEILYSTDHKQIVFLPQLVGHHTKWVVVFKQGVSKITFPEGSYDPLPVLNLADRQWGIIRYYDEKPLEIEQKVRLYWPYQSTWSLDTKIFVDDLKKLVDYTSGAKSNLVVDALNTDLGRKIFERVCRKTLSAAHD